MYTREWLKTVEAFFREKNRAWLSESDGTLLHFLAGTPAECHSWQEVRAMRQSIGERGVKYRKAKTDLRVLSANWHPDQELAVVEALETVRFFYDQKDTLQHEARQTHHRLVLMPQGGHWRLLQDETVGEHSHKGWENETEIGVATEEEDAEIGEQSLWRGRYDRVRAFKYAELWWNGFNPAFQRMTGNDCTNFISQVIYAGGMPMIGRAKNQGWWYRATGKNHSWSYSWAVAHSLRQALPKYLHAQAVSDPRLLKVGDIICYDWDGDGRWQHNTVVVDFDAYGMPLVNAHTIASHRRHFSYRDSYAFTPRTTYTFYHLPDTF